MANVIIFGIKDFAELAHYYLTKDSEHRVIAFCVDDEFMPESGAFKGLPVVGASAVADKYSPSDVSFFAPLSPSNMNRNRKDVYERFKSMGYGFVSYISSRATIFDNEIGENCFILEDNTIQPFTKIGDNVVMWSGNHIGHHGIVGDHVTFTSHVVMSGHCRIGEYSFLGVNSTLRDGIRLAEGTFVAMASAVMRNTHAWGVYKGNPATKGNVLSKDLKF